MNKLVTYVKTTLIGGILVLIPVGVTIFILSKLFNFLERFSDILAKHLPFTNVAGIGIKTLISIFLVLLICFLAGVFLRTRFMQRVITWLEDYILVYIPGYSYLKAVSSSALTKEGTATWRPATVFIDDNEVICFVIDESENYFTIFLPSAPTPSSGTVCAREKTKVKFLSLTVPQTILLIKQFGRGAAKEIEKLSLTGEVAEGR
jgi:uncharacterized membrane protein